MKTNNLLYFVCFAFGIGVGIGCTAGYFKEKYEIMAQTEIESVRKVYTAERKKESIKINTEGFKDIPEGLIINENQNPREWWNSVDIPERTDPEETVSFQKIEYGANPEDIEIIPPIEFGTNFEYEPISLVWYAGDGALVCDDDEITDDISFCIGLDALNHFGEYEDDAVHVRNHARKCDYEVLLDERSWRDVKRP